MPLLRVTDADLWVGARVKHENDPEVQIPLDGSVYRLEEGAWVEARIWVTYEYEEKERSDE